MAMNMNKGKNWYGKSQSGDWRAENNATIS